MLKITKAKLVPYIENILYDTIIPNMVATKEEIEAFQNEPIEYIRAQIDDYTLATKDSLSDLLRCLTDDKEEEEEGVTTPAASPFEAIAAASTTTSTAVDQSKLLPKVDYLKKFLEFSIRNLNEYAAKL